MIGRLIDMADQRYASLNNVLCRQYNIVLNISMAPYVFIIISLCLQLFEEGGMQAVYTIRDFQGYLPNELFITWKVHLKLSIVHSLYHTVVYM